jgi:hypothetical protein
MSLNVRSADEPASKSILLDAGFLWKPAFCGFSAASAASQPSDIDRLAGSFLGCLVIKVPDLVKLRDRFGPHALAMEWDIRPKLKCTKCGSKTPRPNAYGKAKDGR